MGAGRGEGLGGPRPSRQRAPGSVFSSGETVLMNRPPGEVCGAADAVYMTIGLVQCPRAGETRASPGHRCSALLICFMARFPQVGDFFSLALNTHGDLGGCSGEAGESRPGTLPPVAPPRPARPGSSHAGRLRLRACGSRFALDAQVLASTPRPELMEDEPPTPTPVGANRRAGRIPPAGSGGFPGPQRWAWQGLHLGPSAGLGRFCGC